MMARNLPTEQPRFRVPIIGIGGEPTKEKKERPMSSIEKAIDVNVPVHTAYNQWTQFESFPQFMEGVEEVRQLDNKRLHWRAQIGGKQKEWDAEIVEQQPDRRVAWHSLDGAPNDGIVTFQPIDANATRVTLALDYEPEGFLENVGDALGFVSSRVQGDLKRFKQFIESRGAETGAWRGEIHEGQAQPSAKSRTATAAKAGSAPAMGTTERASGANVGGQGEAVLPVVEENIEVGKRQVETGGVRVHTKVEERPVEEQVNLREERVNVERRPVDRPVSDANAAFREQSFEVTEMAEQPVVRKQARVIEEVVINKDVQERTETVHDTVRRQDVHVHEQGAERAVGATGYDAYDADFRRHFQSSIANSGYTYDQYAPIYRYGYTLANDSRYRNSDWSNIEADARTRWEQRNPGTWDEFKDSVRYAWEKARGRA
jgi:uncharacterized protein (TIGR02271 family)